MEKCKYCDKDATSWRYAGRADEVPVCDEHFWDVPPSDWTEKRNLHLPDSSYRLYLDKLQALGQEWEASPEFSNSTEASWAEEESLEELRGSRDEWEACARDYLKELSSYREALGTISVTHDSVECRRLAKWALNAKKAVPDESWYEIAKLRDEIKETRERLKASCDTMVEQEAEIARLRERKPLRIYVDAQAKELGEELVAAQAEIAKLRDDQQGRIKMCFEKDAEIDRLKEELKKFQVLKYAKPGVVKK